MCGKQKKRKEIKEDLTPQKVRAFKAFENMSDEEVDNVIHTLKEFSLITYAYFIKNEAA